MKLNNIVAKKILFLIMIIVCLCNIIFKINNQIYSSLISVALLLLNIYQIVRYKNNRFLFFLFIMLFYFNYSICMGKYIFGGTELLNNLYYQLKEYDVTMSLGINLLFLFNILISCIIDNNDDSNYQYSIIIENSNKRALYFIFIFAIPIFIFIYMIINKIDYNTTYFEYLNIIFIFIFSSTKNKPKIKLLSEIIMLALCLYSFSVGERIGALQIIIVDFLINYLDKIKLKTVILVGIFGIAFLTVMGVYGDLYDANGLQNFTIKRVYKEISERRFTSDTAISAYFPNLACIEGKNNIDFHDRLKNTIYYFTIYTVLGEGNANYTLPNDIVSKYYYHSGGGVITGYFYFWFDVVGVIFISLFIGNIINKCINLKNNKLIYKLYFVFLISTFPRWYLYYPTSLFRGTLIFIVIYLFFKNIFNIKIVEGIDKNETKIKSIN